MNVLLRVVCAGVVVLAGCGGDDSPAGCVEGSTQACLCVGGGMGVQSCVAGGTFGACDCGGTPGMDGGTPPGEDGGTLPGEDGGTPPSGCAAPLMECGDRCVDTSTDEMNCGGCGSGETNVCAEGSFCVMGTCRDVATCPPPFLMCEGDCIDPRTDPDHCGASGACAGGAAGETCGGACRMGRCVEESCKDILDRGLSTGDGLYFVDTDGTGPLAPQEVYCDMTADGGGWTLTYKIRNDVADIADPWWVMVDLGAGDDFPDAPTVLPAGTHFEGPTRESRNAYFARLGPMSGAPEVRSTLLTSGGAVVVDVRTFDWSYAVGMAAGGIGGSPYVGCSSSRNGYVLEAAAATGLTTVDRVDECYSGGPNDIVTVRTASVVVPMFGDGSVGSSGPMYANTTTLFWIR